MKFYNSIGPNPRVVRMFMAEKGLKIPSQDVDLMAGDNRQAEHLARNPHGQMPALELDDGSFVCEILPICEYLEDTNPTPALIGTNPKEKAETRMWTRRIDLNICEPLANGFRFSQGLRLFKDRIVTVPEAADGLKKIAQDRLNWLERPDGGQGIRLRQALHPRRHPAVLLPRFRRAGRPAAQSREQERLGVVRPCEGKALGGGLIALSMASGFGGARRRQCPKMFP